MKTTGSESKAKRKAPPRRACWAELTERRTETGWDGIPCPNGLTQLEYEVLSLPADEKVVRQDRIPLLLGITPAEAAIVLERLKRLGLIDRERILVKDPAPWVWLTHLGVRAANMPKSMVYEPKVGNLAHMDAVVRARIRYLRKYPKALWVPERELRKRQIGKSLHLADAQVEIPVRGKGTKVIVLEVELTTKSRDRLVPVVRRVCKENSGSEIHYLCSNRVKTEVTTAKAVLESRGVKVDHLKIGDLPDLAGIA